VRADALQPEPEVLDEGQRRLQDVRLVALLVGREPIAVVVLPQLGQEGEQLRPERRRLASESTEEVMASLISDTG
jgi:hypothetical protein